MILSMIVAIDQNNGIGKGDDQLAYISADLKRFKALTTGHTIIMGRKTFEALPKGALPNRRNVVITRQTDFEAKGADVVHSLDEALTLCSSDEKVFVIGGGEIYKSFLPVTQELFLTVIDHVFNEATVFFPAINKADWLVVNEEGPFMDEKTQLSYSYQNLRRR
ncbi:dihydrofolate reductase [Carboxylicivirga mesophila]|uniref:Dihydrofolate reductase n=1 Tax=Carboxylicivirga mesophila TaxID=1166478 RepID=A0ABS5K673_9BACT|nr:dihydrofolate reductase [Carboxylicivirga mesophila]MBS2210494.1 dihydrofolate reductase [Carboxylicivirga mesophila]